MDREMIMKNKGTSLPFLRNSIGSPTFPMSLHYLGGADAEHFCNVADELLVIKQQQISLAEVSVHKFISNVFG
jgi:hypothetical protein